MKLLITGGTVFVSRYFAEYFVRKGHEVYVLNRNTRPQVAGVKLIECDRRAPCKLLKNIDFDAVMDITAYTARDINGLLDGLNDFGDYIMISSSAVYPETLPQPFRESDEIGPNKFWGDYGTGKIAAEQALSARVPKAYILRPPYLYGEYNNVYREAFAFDCADDNRPFYLPKDGGMKLQFLHVDDLCRFAEQLLLAHPSQKIFNVGNEPVSIRQWVTACFAAAGKTAKFIEVNDGTPQRSYFPFYDYEYVLDTVAQNGIIAPRIPLDEGLQSAFRWYSENHGEVKKKNYFEYIDRNLRRT